MSGYCECAGGRISRAVGCEHEAFTCAHACAAGHVPPPAAPDARDLALQTLHEEAAAAFAALEPQCYGWRATRECNPFGARAAGEDRACGAMVPSGSAGFCECSGGQVAAVTGCTHAEFTCADACARLPHHSASFKEVRCSTLLPTTG